MLFSSQSGWDGSNIPNSCRVRLDIHDNGVNWLFVDTSKDANSVTWGCKIGDASSWLHIVITQEDKGGAQLTSVYVNGLLKGQTADNYLFYDCMTGSAYYTFFYPCGTNGNTFRGWVDSFGVYDFAWTADQVKAAYEVEKEV